MRFSSFALRMGLVIVLSGLLAIPAAAQPAPTIDANLVRKSTGLTSDDEARIAAYVTHWSRGLDPAETDPSRLSKIQQSIRALGMNVMNLPGITPAFRQSYSRSMVSQLRPMVQSDDDGLAIRAMYLVSRVGTDAALEVVMDEISHANPSRRNAAAAAAKVGIREMTRADFPQISGNTVTTLLRLVRRAADEETSAAALQRQLELLDQIHTTASALPSLLPNIAGQAQSDRLQVLEARARDISADVVEIDAIDMFVRGLRSTFLANPNSQSADGPRLATALTGILKAANNRLNDVDSRTEASAAFSRLISDAEGFLKVIDRSVRNAASPPTPNTRLKEFWDSRDGDGFQQDVQKWETLMEIAPYNR